MTEHTDRALDRTGAAAGLAAVVLLVALFMVFPALPGPDDPVAKLARSAAENRTGLLAGAYAGALLAGALLVFGAVLAARLRRLEGPRGGWWLIALAGIAGTAIGIVGNALTIVLVRAVGHGATGDSLWIGYGADHWLGTLVAVPLAVFLLGIGAGARAVAALPRWLTWLALVVAALFVVGAASVTGDEVDGGVLGVPLLLGYVGLIVWIVGSSVSLWRQSGRIRPSAD